MRFYLFTFLLLTLSGCIEEFEADVPAEDSEVLVVEGTIYAGNQSMFTLSRTQSINTSHLSPRWVLGAIVSVRGSDGSEYLAQAVGGGYYYTCQVGELAPDVEYILHIEVDGEVYESEPQKPLPTENVTEVTGVQITPESNIDILITPDAPFNPDQANYYSWTYDETWEVHPALRTDIYYNMKDFNMANWGPAYYNDDYPNPYPERGWMDSRNIKTIIGGSSNYEGQHIQGLKLYEIDQRDERISHRYSGLIHQRAITKAEYEYELAQREASSEMGGLFTPQPSALPTNIHCLTSSKRVIGYVGCSLNTTDYRFFLNAEDFTTNYMKKDILTIIELPDTKDTALINAFNMECQRMALQGLPLIVWRDERKNGGVLTTGWAKDINQLDVRLKGAYIEKPDFW